MYGNHPYATRRKSDISHNKRASDGAWRTRDGEVHPVTVRRIKPKLALA